MTTLRVQITYYDVYCSCYLLSHFSIFFFFNDTATTEIYTLSLHDALPISLRPSSSQREPRVPAVGLGRLDSVIPGGDRKSTRLNSSHLVISYAVFCLKKKKKYKRRTTIPRVAY